MLEEVLNYAEEECSGVVSSEVVTVGSTSVSNQVFILVDSEGEFGDMKFDGILVSTIQGLAFNQLSDGYTPLVENMFTSSVIDYKTFAVFLNFDEGSEDSNIMFGGYDLAKYSTANSFNYVPVTNTGYWSVAMSQAAVGGNNLTFTASLAIIDTGTSLLGLNPEDYYSIMTVIINSQPENACASDSGINYCNCNNGDGSGFPTITVTLGNYDFDITPKMYISNQYGSADECYILIEQAELQIGTQYSWILGDVFIRGYYINFDMQDMVIGIAPGAQLNSSGSSLPVWAIVVIVIAVIFFVLGLCVIVICCIRRKCRSRGYILNRAPIAPVYPAAYGAPPSQFQYQYNPFMPNQARPQQYVTTVPVSAQSMPIPLQPTNLYPSLISDSAS